MDYTVFDDVEDMTPTDQEISEMNQLLTLADNVGSYQWFYDTKATEDGKLHDGVIAQDLLKVPGLKAAVHKDPNDGHLSIDTNWLATAALGYVAALTRLLLREIKR